MVKIGIIGCGMMSKRIQIPGFLEHPKAKIVALSDVSKDALADCAKQFKVKRTFTDWREMFEEDLDAVSIVTPNYLHAEMTVAAAKSGKHVLVEKPMATSMKEAKAMIDAADVADTILMIDQSHRFLPHNEVAQKILSDGTIGRINTIAMRIGHAGPETWSATGDWFFSKKNALGGALADMGIHGADLMRWLVGKEVEDVSGFVSTLEKDIEVDDNAVATMRFKGGTLGILETSWTQKPGGCSYTICCEKGTMFLEGSNLKVYLTEPGGFLHPDVPTESQRGGAFKYFIDCVVKGEKPFVDGCEGAKSLEIILAIYKSSSIGKTIGL